MQDFRPGSRDPRYCFQDAHDSTTIGAQIITDAISEAIL